MKDAKKKQLRTTVHQERNGVVSNVEIGDWFRYRTLDECGKDGQTVGCVRMGDFYFDVYIDGKGRVRVEKK